MATTTLDTVDANGMTIAYRELGSGPPVLLLHGWPTSSFLWRDVMPPIARRNRVIAIDLPGLRRVRQAARRGLRLRFFEQALDGFLARARHRRARPRGARPRRAGRRALGAAPAARVTKLALLNTLVYPEFSEAVLEFMKACTDARAT